MSENAKFNKAVNAESGKRRYSVGETNQMLHNEANRKRRKGVKVVIEDGVEMPHEMAIACYFMVANAISEQIGKVFGKNVFYMSKKARLERAFVMMARVAKPKTIKGKLSFKPQIGDGDLYYNSNAMAVAIDTNAAGWFGNPFTYMSAWQDANTNLDLAIKAGIIGDIITARDEVWVYLKLVRNYVNGIALLGQLNAVSVINAALMVVIISGKQDKQEFTVTSYKMGAGIIKIKNLASYDSNQNQIPTSYEYEKSADVEPRVPEYLGNSLVTMCKIPGLASNVRIQVRKRSFTTKNGWTIWGPWFPVTPN